MTASCRRQLRKTLRRVGRTQESASSSPILGRKQGQHRFLLPERAIQAEEVGLAIAVEADGNVCHQMSNHSQTLPEIEQEPTHSHAHAKLESSLLSRGNHSCRPISWLCSIGWSAPIRPSTVGGGLPGRGLAGKGNIVVDFLHVITIV